MTRYAWRYRSEEKCLAVGAAACRIQQARTHHRLVDCNLKRVWTLTKTIEQNLSLFRLLEIGSLMTVWQLRHYFASERMWHAVIQINHLYCWNCKIRKGSNIPWYMNKFLTFGINNTALFSIWWMMGQCFFLAHYKFVFSKILIKASYMLRQSILPLLGEFFNEKINCNALNP